MTDLQYKDLFPYIDPLDEYNGECPDVFYLWEQALDNHYGFYIPNGYLNSEKLTCAMNFLKRLHRTNIAKAINVLFKQFDTMDFTKWRKFVLEKGECSIFWVFQTCAFILLNKYVEHPDKEMQRRVNNCFRNADNYKHIWNMHFGQRTGGKNSGATRRNKANFVYGLWLQCGGINMHGSDKDRYEKLKKCYLESDGKRLYGKFYAESSFTRNGKGNKFLQFTNRYNSEQNV